MPSEAVTFRELGGGCSSESLPSTPGLALVSGSATRKLSDPVLSRRLGTSLPLRRPAASSPSLRVASALQAETALPLLLSGEKRRPSRFVAEPYQCLTLGQAAHLPSSPEWLATRLDTGASGGLRLSPPSPASRPHTHHRASAPSAPGSSIYPQLSGERGFPKRTAIRPSCHQHDLAVRPHSLLLATLPSSREWKVQSQKSPLDPISPRSKPTAWMAPAEATGVVGAVAATAQIPAVLEVAAPTAATVATAATMAAPTATATMDDARKEARPGWAQTCYPRGLPIPGSMPSPCNPPRVERCLEWRRGSSQGLGRLRAKPQGLLAPVGAAVVAEAGDEAEAWRVREVQKVRGARRAKETEQGRWAPAAEKVERARMGLGHWLQPCGGGRGGPLAAAAVMVAVAGGAGAKRERGGGRRRRSVVEKERAATLGAVVRREQRQRRRRQQ